MHPHCGDETPCLWTPALLFSVYGHQLFYSVFMDTSSFIQCLWTPAPLFSVYGHQLFYSVFMVTSSSIQCLWTPALLFSVYGHQLFYSVFMDTSSSIQCLWTPALLCDYCYLMVSNWIEAFFLKKRMSKIVHNSTKLVFI